jgi:hypothetical protein
MNMSGIKFDEDNMLGGHVGIKRKKGITQMLVDKGIARDYVQAEKILIGVAIAAIVLTGFVLMGRGSFDDVPAGSYTSVEDLEI